MAKLTTLSQLRSDTARLASFIADALDTVAAAIEEIQREPASVDLTDYLTKDAASNNYVAKVSGKDLSANDYTTAEKNKLAGIDAAAQVNVIETVKVNGTALTVSDKAVDITVGGSDIVTLGTTALTTEGALWLEWT